MGASLIVGRDVVIFHWAMIIYSLIIIPMIYFVFKYIPKNELVLHEKETKNLAATKAFFQVLRIPEVWLTSLASLTVYWSYINLIYTVPYLQAVFNITTTQTALFGIINTGAMGIVAGIVAGSLSDFVFKSSSKMMCVALGLCAIILFATLLLPKTQIMLIFNIILLFFFSFAIFLARSVILTPLAEINLPKNCRASAMNIGSFLAYASVFWAYSLNGKIIDANLENPMLAYQKIFTISIIVATIGSLCAGLNIFMKKRYRQRPTED
ncbi:MAG: MFS transporter [Fusobacteriaceae bacterium]